MSTRCNVIVKDAYGHLVFYRHCDGYPEGVKDTLLTFMERVENGVYRDNVEQSAGWLVVLGYEEYKDIRDFDSWEVGAYEPSVGIHGDIEYLYVLDLETRLVHVGTANLEGWETSYKPWPVLTRDYQEDGEE